MTHACGRVREFLTRREMLTRSAGGFGAVALSARLAEEGRAQDGFKGLHHAPRAKSVIFLYMDGGPSQVDTFDPKPMLEKHVGKDPEKVIGRVEKTQFNNNGKVMRCPWSFAQRGKSGI